MAVKNTSEKALTVRDMINLLPSDNWSIDKILYYCIYDNTMKVQLYTLLDDYYYYFKQYLVEVDVNEKYYYCPQLFAQDYYGDAGLDFLVMYFSNITSNFEFNKPKIKVLDYVKLKEINQLFTRYKTEIEKSKTNPPTYSSNSNTALSSVKYLK